ncbi:MULTISPECIES: hypothetical protein [Bacillaceae]|uniref:Peptidyl-prolyl cis-trans isomerase n=2 Tax=Bacillaceae TaxID=186817 RepID=A0A9D5I1D6_9BACI|nr:MULTISPECIES: hypothetical protein [Bacillaceae]KQL58120.1 hypothetical protein AN965_04915 [Alkalicoccobacillus plakortidis]MBG9784197.1 hypothetical protein [Shouchella lehensis]RQW20790.1 peptidyl-prolyl cis-trans isomerase [Bacillus sp. C1-1]TES50815.1 peptidyl-prolyl cis-trans isomerase [Shouchella lehensis]
MQEFVFFISGKVKKPLTIDPTVWIFDERKIDLTTFFESNLQLEEENDLIHYTQKISQQFDKEMLEGSEPPNPNRDSNRIKYNRQELINGSFGMPLRSFIRNAAPYEDAQSIVVETTENQHVTLPIEKADYLIAAFSDNGKPLHKDGPVHLYVADGVSQTAIKRVKQLSFI